MNVDVIIGWALAAIVLVAILRAAGDKFLFCSISRFLLSEGCTRQNGCRHCGNSQYVT